MTNLDLTSLNKRQLAALLWELKGTPAARPVYLELRSRSPEVRVEASDLDWDSKTDEALKQALGITARLGQQA